MAHSDFTLTRDGNISHAINDLGNSLYFLTGERVETFCG